MTGTGAIHPERPEEKPTLMTKISEMATSALQSFYPLKSVHHYLTSIHAYVGEPGRQVISHHFCAHLSEDFRQCLIYDRNSRDAKLIGIEYIISAAQFEALPETEKAYWHSHQYEVCSGLLTMPGAVPEALEFTEMQKLHDTYGKTWHFWQVDRGDPLPYGPAKLMATFTADGQVNSQLVNMMDMEIGGSDVMQRRQYRAKKGLTINNTTLSPKADRFNNYRDAQIG
jgi:hypothetical protein